MKKIISGNLDRQISSHPETNGWFLGCFMEKYPDFLSDEVELKWARHKKGEKKPGLFAKTTTKSFVILVQGKCCLRFPKLDHESILSGLGDFVFYDANQTDHEVEALEDCLLLVVRFPSRRRA